MQTPACWARRDTDEDVRLLGAEECRCRRSPAGHGGATDADMKVLLLGFANLGRRRTPVGLDVISPRLCPDVLRVRAWTFLNLEQTEGVA